MSEEDPESSTPEKEIDSESLSRQSAKSLDEDEEVPQDEYTNPHDNQDISDKNGEIIENENDEVINPIHLEKMMISILL